MLSIKQQTVNVNLLGGAKSVHLDGRWCVSYSFHKVGTNIKPDEVMLHVWWMYKVGEMFASKLAYELFGLLMTG